MGKRPNGATCTLDGDCANGYCIDGVCCESSCTGTCRTCANATGTCTFAAAGTDPHTNCKGDLNCGGKCNGQGSCLWAPATTQCRQSGCQPDIGLITKSVNCDGAGNCPTDPSTIMMDCGGFGCDNVNGAPTCRTDCSTDPECAIRRYCEVVADGGVADGGAKSTCPPVFPQGHACVRNAQCSTGACSDGVCCDINCDKCGSCNIPGSVGTCIPVAAGTDPNSDCIDSASDPTGKCGGMCDGHAKCLFPGMGTVCGQCKTCNGVGLCSVMPADDATCGTIDCTGLNTMPCRVYSNLTSNRCDSLGVCKKDNTVKACTVVVDNCTPDGGTTGTGGSIGGSGGRGGSTGTGGGGTGTAGATGTGGSTGGSKGGGGGGCCSVGGADLPHGLAALLALACVMITRRRRR